MVATARQEFGTATTGFPAAPPFSADMGSSAESTTRKKLPQQHHQGSLIPPDEVPEDATLVSMDESGSISYMESIDNSTSMITSPPKGDLSPGTALQRNRMKKRTIESQLAAWRDGIGRAKVTKPSSLKNLERLGDGPPPLVDWEDSESDLASYKTWTNNSRNDQSLMDSLGASASITSMPVLVDYDAPEDSLRLGQFSRLANASKAKPTANSGMIKSSVDDTKSISSKSVSLSPEAKKKLNSSARRASIDAAPLTLARVTTGGFISDIIFSNDTESTARTETSDSRMRSPRASPRMRIKKQRRSSLGSEGLPSNKTDPMDNVKSAPRRGSLGAFMSGREDKLSPHSDHVVSPGKVVLHRRPRSSKSDFAAGDSSLTSERTSTASQRCRVKSEGYTRTNRFTNSSRSTSGTSSVATGRSEKSKDSTTSEDGKGSHRDKKKDTIDGQESDLASVGSYETMRSCSTRKRITRTNSGVSMASSIDSMGKASDDASNQIRQLSTTPARRQGRRNSTGGASKVSNEQLVVALPKINVHLKHERRGSTGSSIPRAPVVIIDSLPIGKAREQQAQSEKKLNIDINVRASRRPSIGTTYSPSGNNIANHMTSQNLAQKQHVQHNARLSGAPSSKYAPVTASIKEEIGQIVLKPKHPANGRSMASVELWNGSNTTAGTASIFSWKSNTDPDKPSSVLSTTSSKNSNRKPDSTLSVQSKQSDDQSMERNPTISPPVDPTLPSRSRRIMNRLNIFKSKRESTAEVSAGSKQRRRASADGATTDASDNGYQQSPQAAYRPKGPRARRRASTGAVSEPYVDSPSKAANLATTGAFNPQEPVQLASPKRAARAGRRLSLGLLRMSAKKG